MLTLLLVLTTVGCDRVTKHLATANLAGNPARSYWSDTVRLEYAENPGAFLSLGATLPDWARTGLLTFGAAFGLLAVAVAAFKLRWRGIPFIGTILFLSGGASNLVDRIAHGVSPGFAVHRCFRTRLLRAGLRRGVGAHPLFPARRSTATAAERLTRGESKGVWML